MEVDGTLSLWTTLLGWHYYNIVWGLLVASGIAFLPIAGMVLDHLVEARSRGSLMTQRGDSIFSGIEMQIFLVILVLMLAVRPSGATGLSSASFKYTPGFNVYSDNTDVRVLNDTDTALDGVAASSEYNIASGTVNVPPIWFVVLQASSGFSHAIASNIDDRDDVYRAIRDIAGRVAVTDPGLKMVIEDFNTQCYTRALAMYIRGANNRSVFLDENALTAGQIGADQEGPDIGWMGSGRFQQDYYSGLQVDNPVAGFAYDSDVDTQFAAGSIPSQGAPSCQEYWVSIRESIHAKAVDDGTIGILDRARNVFSTGFNLPTDGPNFRDGIAQAYLANTELSVSRTADSLMAAGSSRAGTVQRTIRWGAEALQAIEMAKLAATAELFTSAVINALVYIQAYSLMLLYMCIPLIMVFSRYSLGAVTGTAAMIFLLKFLPVVWALIAWIDNTNGLALWNGKNMFSIMWGGGPEALTARFVHSVSIALLYTTSGAIFLSFMALSGIRAAFAIGNAGRSISGVGGGITAQGPAQALGTGPIGGNLSRRAGEVGGDYVVGRGKAVAGWAKGAVSR